MTHRKGFTLIEVLIVVAILVLLIVALMVSMRTQRQKAEDARVKNDLQDLKIAFENYYNDNNCYPPVSWFDSAADCGSNVLQPYLTSIPCDPRTAVPYKMETVGGACSGYKLYGTLTNAQDPSATSQCVTSGGSTLGNYGVSSSNTSVGIACNASPSPIGSVVASAPPHSPGPYACQTDICKNFGAGNTCDPSWSDQPTCQTYCASAGHINCQ